MSINLCIDHSRPSMPTGCPLCEVARLRHSLAAIIGIDADKPAETVAAMRSIARMALTPRATPSEERKP